MFKILVNGVEHKVKFHHTKQINKSNMEVLATECLIRNGSQIFSYATAIPFHRDDQKLMSKQAGKKIAFTKALIFVDKNDRVEAWKRFFETYPEKKTDHSKLNELTEFLKNNFPEALVKYSEYRR